MTTTKTKEEKRWPMMATLKVWELPEISKLTEEGLKEADDIEKRLRADSGYRKFLLNIIGPTILKKVKGDKKNG